MSDTKKSKDEGRLSHWYIGGGGFWADRKSASKWKHETNEVSLGHLGWHAELGYDGPLGLRARYGEAEEYLDHTLYVGQGATFQFAQAEAQLRLPLTTRLRLYGSGGAQWTADKNDSPRVWTVASVLTVGLDFGSRAQHGIAVYAESQWIGTGLPAHTSAAGRIERKAGILFVGGLRVY